MLNGRLIIAHRGASFYEKENTISSFKKAIELNADMIEFDVRKTSDNKIIIFHDEEINEKKVSEMGHKEIENKIGYEVPTLEEALRFLKGKIKLDVHLKEEGYEDEVMDLILKYFKINQVIVSSESHFSLKKIRENYPNIKTGFIIQVKGKDYYKVPFGLIRKKKLIYSKADYVIPPWQIINKIFLIKAKKLNKPILPWAIDNKKLARKLLRRDIVKGIITNKPDLILNQ